jgi:serine protease Do
MLPNLFRPISVLGAAVTLLIFAGAPAFGGDAPLSQQHFWTELSNSGGVAKAQTMPDFVDLAAKLSPAVVNISTDEADEPGAESEAPQTPPPGEFHSPFEDYGGPRPKSLGSGFIVSKDGLVITNDHVIENPSKITVTTQDGRNYTARLIGRDAKTDVALLKIDAKHDLPVAPLGNSDDLKVGEWVMAIGNPFGFDHSVTVGVVSAKGRFIPGNFDDFIQTDASINPGNSGGPLIDTHGEVIGVNSAIYTRTGSNMGIGFAIPVNMVKDELLQLRSAGKVVRGWLGVYIQHVTPELAETLGLPEAKGALVAEVLKDGPAKKAGVNTGDVIVAYDNQPIDDQRELPLMVSRTGVGQTATLSVIRDKQVKKFTVTITESKETELASAETPEKPEIGTPSPFGLHVKDLSADLAHELGISAKGGVVIASVAPGSRADEAGLRARDVILEVNRASVQDVDAYQQALKQSGKGKMVLLLVRRDEGTMYFALKPEA